MPIFSAKSPARRQGRKTRLHRGCRALLAGIVVFSWGQLPASAVDRPWTGATSTDWGTAGNWTGGLPGGTDNAVFNSTFTNQPNVGTVNTVGGFWMTGGIGQNVTISGASTLTLNGNPINGTSGLGILIDNANAFTPTITAPVKLGGAQIWRNNSANLFTVGAGGVNLNGNAFTIDGTGNTAVTGVMSGAGAFTKDGTGTLALSGANTYTGATSIIAGALTVSGTTGTISASSTVTVSPGATLNLDNTAGSLDRVGNSATLTLNGATLVFTGNGATTSTTETVSTLAIGAGASIITLNGAGAGQLQTLSAAAAFSRAGNGTALIRGTSLQTQATNSTRLLINGPSATGLTLVGGGTAAVGTSTAGTTKTLSIVPYLIGDTSSSGNGSSFLTYDTTAGTGGGLRPLASGEYTTLTAGYTTPGTPENVKAFNGTITTASPTVNSLLFSTATRTLAGSGTLTVESGAIAATANTEVISGFSGLTLGNGTWNEGVITTTGNNTLAINVPIAVTGGGGLTKTGAGTLTLGNINSFTGNTTVNAGTLTANADGALGSTAKVTINTGGTVLLGSTAGNDRIGNTTEIALAGGTLHSGGFSETVGKMSLSANSTLDLGAGASLLTFDGASSLGSSTLSVLNWSGTQGSTGGTDQLLFTNSSFVAGTSSFQIQFNVGGTFYAAAFRTINANTIEAIASITPVPEPSTIFGASAIALMISWRERRRITCLLTAHHRVCTLNPDAVPPTDDRPHGAGIAFSQD